MKNFFFTMLLLLVAGAFVACSDDKDDDNGNGNSDKKVVKIILTQAGSIYEEENGTDEISLTYDTQGRLSTMGTYKAEYIQDKVLLIDTEDANDLDTTIYVLANGRVAYREGRGNNQDFTYDKDDYLATIKSTGLTTYTTTDGKLTKIIEEAHGATYTLEYEKNIPNNATYDFLADFDIDEYSYEPRNWNIAGKKSTQLPTSITFEYKGSDKKVVTHYEYEIKDGLVVKITETSSREDKGIYTTEIIYE